MASKVILQQVCKILQVSNIGTSKTLKSRICYTINTDKNTIIVKDIIEMLDDDSELANIGKYLSKKHNYKISKSDLSRFADIWDAAKKKDFTYITEYIEQYSPSKKVLILLKSTNNQKLIESIP